MRPSQSLAPAIAHRVLRSSGRPLEPETRARMEPKFGQDFSAVRIHTDSQASESARAVDAHAYTVGRDVVFGAGRYSPESRPGQKLLAHELAHVAQQRGAAASTHLEIGAPNDAYEREADRAAETVDQGSALTPALTAGGTAAMRLQRAGPAGAETGKPQNADPAAQKHVCGPNVTGQVATVLSSIQTYFLGLNHYSKCAHCHALHDPITGIFAWDINPLYCSNGEWIDAFSNDGGCATPGFAGEPCDEPASTCRHSVLHSGKCVLAGTVNYFMWGQMHRLCNAYAQSAENSMYGALPSPLGPSAPIMIGPLDFSAPMMNFYISLYKGFGLVEDPTAPKAFAAAAFASGAGAAAPLANRGHCSEICPPRTEALSTNAQQNAKWTWTWVPFHLQKS